MKTIKKILCISVLWVVACQLPHKEVAFTESDLNVIPQPQSLTLGKGSFRFTKETVFVIDPALMPARLPFLEQFEKASGFRFSVQKVALLTNYVVIDTDTSLPKEGYTLTVNPKEIIIKAGGYNGALYALETLRQLLPKEFESTTPVKTDWAVSLMLLSTLGAG